MSTSKSWLFILIICSQTLIGCFKKEEIKKLEIPPFEQGWGIPLIDTKLILKDFVAVIDSNIGLKEESDKSYTFYYYDTISSPTAEELLVLPDQTFSQNIEFPLSLSNLIFPIGAPPITGKITESAIFDPGNGGKIKLIVLNNGLFSLKIDNTFQHEVTLVLTFESVIDKQGQPLIKKILIPPVSSNTLNIPLNGYSLKLSSKDQEVNTLNYSIDYSITSSGAPVNAKENIAIQADLKNLRFASITGNIGQLKIPDYKGSFDLTVFEQASYGNIHFSQAKVRLLLDNSFGLPLSFKVNKLHTSTFYGKELDILDSNFKFKNLLYPLANQMGTSVTTPIVLDSSNSKITDAINPAPNKLDYDFSTSILSGDNSFILNTSRVKAYTQIQLPIKGYISSYEVRDTVPIEKLPERKFDEDNFNASIDSALFKIKFENQMPMSAYGQLYFLDSTYKIIDSLVLNPHDLIGSDFISAGTGNVNIPTIRESVISMSGNRYDPIYNRGTYFSIVIRFKTTVDKATGKPYNVTLQSDNSFRIIMSVLTKGKIKIK